MIRSWQTLLPVMIAAAMLGSAHADDRFYLGRWTVTHSMPAPWAAPGEAPDASDLKALIGKTIIFQAGRIVAPSPLDCRAPHYVVVTVPPAGLFQGSLTDPPTQAATLGFPPAIRTVQTGCAFDFHFVDEGRAMFALNDRVYVMERRRK